MSTAYFIVPRGAGGAEIILDDLNAAKRRADKLGALVRENGLKGKVVHGAGGRPLPPRPLTDAERAHLDKTIDTIRAELLAQQAENDEAARAYDARMAKLSAKKED